MVGDGASCRETLAALTSVVEGSVVDRAELLNA